MQVEDWKKTTLETIFYHVGHRTDVIEDVFGCHMDDFFKKKFTSTELILIASRIGVSIDAFFHRQIDWQTMKSKYFSEKLCIPDEYMFSAGTHMSSIRSIFSFFESRYTKQASQNLLLQLDLHPDILLNDRIKLNNNFLNKMFSMMIKEYSLSKTDIELMSLMVHRYSMRSSVVNIVKSCPSNTRILKLMVENAARYELNNEYFFEATDSNVFITSKSRYPISESAFKMCPMSDPLVFFKLSTFKNITRLSGRAPITIRAHDLSIDRGHQVLKIKFDNSDCLSSFRSPIVT